MQGLNMIKRIRDKVPALRRTEQISFDDWEQIKDRYAIAKKFFSEDNPISTILKEDLKNAESMILENRVKEVREIKSISEGFQKIFITPKKVQDDEIVGQIKYIRGILAEVESWITFKEELEAREARGEVVIDHDGPK